MTKKEKQAIRDALFDEWVSAGLAKCELEAMISRRPDLYGRYAIRLDSLPETRGQ